MAFTFEMTGGTHLRRFYTIIIRGVQERGISSIINARDNKGYLHKPYRVEKKLLNAPECGFKECHTHIITLNCNNCHLYYLDMKDIGEVLLR